MKYRSLGRTGWRLSEISFGAWAIGGAWGSVDAYAITIHKLQASEFPAVVVPLSTQQYLLMQSSLVYAGITRGTYLVGLIGQARALGMLVRDNTTERRFSGLLAQLLMPARCLPMTQ
jgi:uncharacterized membrane protein YsdA (DUF1294 family)